MKYDEALRRWGEKKIRDNWYRGNRLTIVPETVKVSMVFSEGVQCCDGSNGCYCSLAEDPSATVSVHASTTTGGRVYYSMEARDFDFQTMLTELLEIADGTITR